MEEWTRIACAFPGPELEPLANFARVNRAYVARRHHGVRSGLSEPRFNSAYLFGPSGDLVLRYRKINGADVQGHTTYSTPTAATTLREERGRGRRALPGGGHRDRAARAHQLIRHQLPGDAARLRAARRRDPAALHGRAVWTASGAVGDEPAHARLRELHVRHLVQSRRYAAQVSGNVFADSPGLNFQERRDGEISPLHRSHGGSEIVDFNGKVAGASPNPGEALAIGPIDLRALRERRAEYATTSWCSRARRSIPANTPGTREPASPLARSAHRAQVRGAAEHGGGDLALSPGWGLRAAEGYEPAAPSEQQNRALA